MERRAGKSAGVDAGAIYSFSGADSDALLAKSSAAKGDVKHATFPASDLGRALFASAPAPRGRGGINNESRFRCT